MRSTPAPTRASIRVPATLADRYTVDRELGRGGMATVYLGTDRKHGRAVAIKVLNPEIAASLGADRFLREIRIAARLAHPHILPLIDSGEAGGNLFFVMPHVPDGSLRQKLGQQKQLALADVVRIAHEVGGALDYAHRQGFIHRDVKPENILFADGVAVLADFGIARAFNAAGSDVVTEVGLAIGTPDYMSPEQATGESTLTGKTDLYSLACVVYEMLTGSPPFTGPTAQAIMARQVTRAADPVRLRRPDLPGRVEETLARALAKDPGARFASVAAFVAALEDGDSPGPAIAAPPVRGIAVLPFVNASPDPENEYLSDGITDELIAALAKVDGLRIASRTSAFALKGKPQDIRAIGALLGVDWVLEGTVRRADDRLRVTTQLTSVEDGRLIWSERYDRTLADVFAIQEELARTIVETLQVTSFVSLTPPFRKRYTENLNAYRLYLRGRFAENKRTQRGVSEAIDYFGQAIAEDPRYAPAYAGLADSYALALDYKSVPVEEGLVRAKEAARQALELDDSLAEAHASLAWVLFIYDWDWEGAEREFRQSIALDPRYAPARQWYSMHLAARGRHEQSIIEAHAALELDPVSVSVRRSVAWAYYYARHYESARQYLSRAITMNPSAEETFRLLGLVLGQLGQWSECANVLRQAQQLSGNGPYYRATLGWALANAGDRAGAEAILAALTRESQSSYVSPVGFATIHLGLGNREPALAYTEKALVERRGWLAYLKTNPILDQLRPEPRFKKLLEQMNLS